MVFTEPAFLFFFLPILLGFYFLLGPLHRLRNLLLLLASLFFYAWGEGKFVLIMVASILFNYGIGLWMDRQQRLLNGAGKWPLTVGVVINLAFLAVFKYADFIAANLNSLLAAVGAGGLMIPEPHIALPIGISFYTFQAMSYVIDVYRGKTQVQRSPADLGLYISLFPQLIAGPIVRYPDIAAQIVSRRVTREVFADGVRRFIIGLGKKLIIADTCARTADMIFGVAGGRDMTGVPPEQLTVGLAWLASVCYALQIYFDFSGYSDMAVGLGRMFGFRFLENFHYPYVSQSITEFWRRWHISLSSWFRDYVYFPLGGSHGSRLKTYRNLVVVFFLCGLWHGASWTFVCWGLLHGGFIVLERIGLADRLEKTFRPVRHLYVLFVVLVGWVIFRAETSAQAIAYIAALSGMAGGDGVAYHVGMYADRQLVLAIALGVIGSTPLVPALKLWRDAAVRTIPANRRTVFCAATEACTQTVLVVMLLVCAMLAGAQTYSPFIYFRF